MALVSPQTTTASEQLIANVAFDAPQTLAAAYGIADAGGTSNPLQVYYGYDLDEYGYGYYSWETTTGLTAAQAEAAVESGVSAQLGDHVADSGEEDAEEYADAILELVATLGVVVDSMDVEIESCEAADDVLAVEGVASVTVLDVMLLHEGATTDSVAVGGVGPCRWFGRSA
jgi:hypothetical protein